jgi:3-isopropylmalate/(R)-2-methylmalate dehydratase small subunit
MEPFKVLTAVAAPLLRANIDTDIIIPSREMKTVAKTGLSDGLFAGWRYTVIGGRELNPNFVLNQTRYADTQIILGGENFGCGSSREHAVWALHEYGIRSVIAPSFSPIFYGNCVRNGIVPVRLAIEAITTIAADVEIDPQLHRVTVDLERCEVARGESRWQFVIEPEARDMLLEGLDGIDLTFKNRAQIEEFQRLDRQRRPWIYLEKQS